MDQLIEMKTVDETTAILRGLGMKVSQTTIRQGLKQRVLPFGDYIETENGTPVFYIYKRKLDEWIRERVKED